MADTPTLTVRRGTLQDIDVLVSGNTAMARETEELSLDLATLRAGVGAVLRGQADGHYYLAEDQQGIAGQLMITREWSDWRNAWVWWIQSVYVWPASRRRGVYAALYQRVLQDGALAGAAGVRLYVDERNSKAQQVYASLGMDGDHYRVFEHMLVELAAQPTDQDS